MLDQIDPLLWAEWQAFGRLRPFGDRRADLRSAILALSIDRVVASSSIGINGMVLDPKVLMPYEEESLEASGWEDPDLQMSKLEMLAQRWTAK